jgi:hypothetical protein
MLARVVMSLVSQIDEYTTTDIAMYLDFRTMVEPSMALEYGKKHFAPALHSVIK